MKPMLKADFYALITDLLARGMEPELQTSVLTCWGNITWKDAEGKKQVRQLFSSHDCSPLTARTSRKRFHAWFIEAQAQFHEKAAEKLEVGARVMIGTSVGVITAIRVRTLREPNGTPKAQQRTGVILIDDKFEVKAGTLRTIDYLDECDFHAFCLFMLHSQPGHRHIIQVVPGAVRLRWALSGTTTRTKHIDLYTHNDQKLVEGHARVLTRWFNTAYKDAEDYARGHVLSDQATERAVERWFEGRGYGA